MDNDNTLYLNKGNMLRLVALSAGHFINDFYMGTVQPILFAFVEALSLTMAQQGLIAFSLTASGSLLQPVIGHIVDRHGRSWWLILAVAWISFWISISGIISSYPLLITVLVMGGLASALYHPLGSSFAIRLMPGQPGTSLSLFMTIGGLAISAAPAIALLVVTNYGLDKLVYFMVPGFITAFAMCFSGIHRINIAGQPTRDEQETSIDGIKHLTLVSAAILTLISAARWWVRISLITYGAQFFNLKFNMTPALFGIFVSIHLFAASFSTLLGGYLSDVLGNKRVFIISMLLATLSVGAVVQGSRIIAIIGYALAGPFLAAPNTANIIMAREYMPDNATLATGLIMGLGGGLGGLGVLVQGYLADITGLTASFIYLLIPLGVSCGLLLLLAKSSIKA